MTLVIPKITSLSKSVIRVLGCNPGPMTLQGTNTYIIGTGKRRVLLDCGEENNLEYMSLLKSVLNEHKIVLESIVISHWHSDHIGALKNILCTLEGHGEDLKVFKWPRSDVKENYEIKSLNWLNRAHDLSVQGATLKVHHTPGHTTDHIILKLKEENAVFSGDCILGEGTAVFEDLHSYMTSLSLIHDLKPSVIYPGHGPVISNPVQKIMFYIEHRNERENQIMSVLKENSTNEFTPLQIVQIVYKDTPSHLHSAAAYNVSHHLKKLLKDDKVICCKDDFWKFKSDSLNSNL